MEDELCSHCRGTGEVMRLTGLTPEDASWEYVPCFKCHSGVVSDETLMATEAYFRTTQAMQAAIFAVEKYDTLRSKK
jgi:hypothetical protein